jgi:hypothetical protein
MGNEFFLIKYTKEISTCRIPVWENLFRWCHGGYEADDRRHIRGSALHTTLVIRLENIIRQYTSSKREFKVLMIYVILNRTGKFHLNIDNQKVVTIIWLYNSRED